jgi:hypothetical protein
MPLLKKGVLIPAAGIDYSKPATFINERNGFPVNMRFYRNEMRKIPGRTKYGSVAISGGQVMALNKLELNSGEKYLLRASKTAIERYNTVSGGWDSITGTALSGGDDDRFSFANLTEAGMVIITNYANLVRKYTGSGNLQALGGNPPKAKFVTYLAPYAILGGIELVAGGMSMLQWCDTDQPEVWSGGNSGSTLLTDDPSPLVNIEKLNDFVAAYKRDSLWTVRKVDTDIFYPECVKTGVGLAAQDAVVGHAGYHYFMSLNDFILWNGTSIDSFGGPVRDEIFSKINRAKINRCFALHVQELDEIWFFVVIVGQEWPTEIWKYNYANGFWYYDTCNSLTCATKWEKISTTSWDEITPGWDDYLPTWDSGVQIQDWEEIVLGRSDGYTLRIDHTATTDDGLVISSRLDTPDFTGDYLEYKKRWLQLNVWGRGPGKVYVDYSTDYGDSWTNIPYSSTQAYIDWDERYVQTTLYFDIVAEVIRFRFRNAESGEVFYIRNYYPFYLVTEPILR